jgi:NAD(P)H-hydrate repair Nnr-like enzyme with NAD(P)H-hydrate dehydratase domain
MVEHNWLRQTNDQPLFKDLLWSRPENKKHAGKLLIIGGNQFGFAAPAEAYSAALKAGIGSARVILPSKLEKTVARIFPSADYAASTSTGSFSQGALAEFLEQAQWSDGTLIAGDLAHNSETAILLEKFVSKYDGLVTITKDAADYFTLLPQPLVDRESTTLVISIAQLQKLAKQIKFQKAFTFDMDLVRLTETLAEFTKQYPIHIVIKHFKNIFVAVKGQVSVTRLDEDIETWRVATAASTAVWWLQNKSNPFGSMTTALLKHVPSGL